MEVFKSGKTNSINTTIYKGGEKFEEEKCFDLGNFLTYMYFFVNS